MLNFKLKDNRTSYPETFKQELNYQCGKILTFASLITLLWLTYIPIDLQLHPDKSIIIAIRIGFPVFGLILFLLRFNSKLRTQNLLLLTVYGAYLEISTAILTGLTEGDAVYIGGYLFILTLIAVGPLQKIYANLILAGSLIAFFSTSYLSGMRSITPHNQYSLNDIICVSLVAFGLIHILNNTRYSNWFKSKQVEIGEEEIRKLSGLLPICASCKKIRDDNGYWMQIEKYIGEHSEAQFTHSICPECTERLYPELNLNSKEKRKQV